MLDAKTKRLLGEELIPSLLRGEEMAHEGFRRGGYRAQVQERLPGTVPADCPPGGRDSIKTARTDTRDGRDSGGDGFRSLFLSSKSP